MNRSSYLTRVVSGQIQGHCYRGGGLPQWSQSPRLRRASGKFPPPVPGNFRRVCQRDQSSSRALTLNLISQSSHDSSSSSISTLAPSITIPVINLLILLLVLYQPLSTSSTNDDESPIPIPPPVGHVQPSPSGGGVLLPPPPPFLLMQAPTSPLYLLESPPLPPLHLSSVLNPSDLPVPSYTVKYEFRITPSLTWAPFRLGIPFFPVLEVQENFLPSCQGALMNKCTSSSISKTLTWESVIPEDKSAHTQMIFYPLWVRESLSEGYYSYGKTLQKSKIVFEPGWGPE